MYIVFPRFRIRISIFALPILMLMLWLEGVDAFLVIILSALAHELGHLLAMRVYGYRARRVDILPMGALIVVPEGIPYSQEVIIALGGPIASIVCAAASGMCFAVVETPLALLGILINLTLAIFNLLPITKLDGGKALTSLLQIKSTNQKTAEHICFAASTLSKSLVIAFLIMFISASGYNLGVILLSATLVLQLFK